jgi:hypothetical protein
MAFTGLRPVIANPFDEAASNIQLSPQRMQELMQEANSDNGGFLSDLFWVLDTPGAMARGALSDGLQGATNALSQTEEERVSGRDLLRQYGLAGEEDNWGNFFGGLGAEVVLDPLAWATGGVKSLTGAGKAAAKAGLLNRAPELLSRGYLRGGSIAPELSSAADDALRKLGKATISETEVAGKPLVGRRAAYRHGTLGDLVQYADDPDAARQSVLDALKGDEASYERLAGQKLGRNFGVALPLANDPFATFNVPVLGDAFGAGMDKLADYARWSLPGRALAQFSNNAVGQALDGQSQAFFQGASDASARGRAAGRRESVFEAAKLFQQEPDVFSEGGNRALGRLIEKPSVNPNQATDAVWNSAHPAARQYMDWWDRTAQELPEEFAQLGLASDRFSDPNISGYLPRRTEGALEIAGQRDKGLGRVLKTLTPDQLQRSEYMQVPGGRDTLAFDLSQDPFVAGPKRAAKNDAEAAAHISQKLYGDPAANSKQSIELSQLLHRLPDNLTKDSPLYGQHPAYSITKYVEGREGSKATQDAIYDILAHGITQSKADLAEGGRHISLNEALNKIGARTTTSTAGDVGARQQMRERLAGVLKTTPDNVDLGGLSVSEDLVDRMMRVREGFTNPQATESLVGFVNETQRVWKNSILSWPSRVNRDLYSGAFSNWLEGAFDLPSVGATRELMAKSAFSPAFQEWLAKSQRYSRIPIEDRAAQYYADLAATGLLDGSYLADRGRILEGGPIQDMLVGTTPETYFGAFKELGKNWDKFAVRDRTNPLGVSFENNPILRYGAAAGSYSDKLNRLTGYNSLIAQGVDPMEAARRMKRAHVDYSSLTPQERQIRDKFFPFYAYWSRSFQDILRQIAERPGGRYGQMIRGVERAQEGDEYVPEHMRRQFAAQIDPNDPLFGWMADQSGNSDTFFTGVDLPGMNQLQGIESWSPAMTLSNFAMNANPYLKTGVELINQRDLFTGTPLEASSRGYGAFSKLARAAAGDQNAGSGIASILADKAIDMAPVPGLARGARFAAQMADQDSGVGFPTRLVHSLGNNLGVGRTRDVTPDMARRDFIENLQDQVSPYTREIVSPYIPESMQPFVPYDAQEKLAAARQLQKESRDARRQRRTMGFGEYY